jgi:hypothetical protein
VIAFAPVDQLLRPVVLLERLDEINRRLALAGPRDRARQHTERAWVEMCLRDRHEPGTWGWKRWDTLMQLDTTLASALADRFVLEYGW